MSWTSAAWTEPARWGLWRLAVPAAVLAPVVVTVAVAHRDQWPVGALGPWQGWVGALAWRVWAAAMGLLVAGHAATLAPVDPRPGLRLVAAWLRTLAAVSICTVAAAPAAVWLARLGLAHGSAAVTRPAAAFGLVALAGAASALVGTRAPAAVAFLVGIAVVGGGEWLWAR